MLEHLQLFSGGAYSRKLETVKEHDILIFM